MNVEVKAMDTSPRTGIFELPKCKDSEPGCPFCEGRPSFRLIDATMDHADNYSVRAIVECQGCEVRFLSASVRGRVDFLFNAGPRYEWVMYQFTELMNSWRKRPQKKSESETAS